MLVQPVILESGRGRHVRRRNGLYSMGSDHGQALSYYPAGVPGFWAPQIFLPDLHHEG